MEQKAIITRTHDLAKAKWYAFRQNNSGGVFVYNDDVAEYTYIQAYSTSHANSIAEEIGIYFDGCSTGQDCRCCGDRWHRAYEGDAEDHVEVDEWNAKPFRNIDKAHIILYPLTGEKELWTAARIAEVLGAQTK